MTKPTVFPSIDAFRAAAKDGAAPAEAQVRAAFAAEVKAGEGDSRTLTFTISTAAVDRMGDTIAVDGWQLDNYRKNPVVLWAHDNSLLPVAKAAKVWIESGKLKAEAEFTPPGMARFNDTVFDMYKGGFLNATSVGFQPVKYAFVDDPNRRFGIDFLEQELLEFSCVTVPANPEALVESKAAGIDIAPMLDWCADQVKRHLDAARIIALADEVLGRPTPDDMLRDWAQGVMERAGLATVSRDRLERIERAARQKRLAEKRARDLDLLRLRGA